MCQGFCWRVWVSVWSVDIYYKILVKYSDNNLKINYIKQTCLVYKITGNVCVGVCVCELVAVARPRASSVAALSVSVAP